MQLLYLDDSGSLSDPASRVFILAGCSIFERQTHWIEQKLDRIAERFNPGDARAIELHGSPMFGGRGSWRAFPVRDRHTAMLDALAVIRDSHVSVKLFGVALDPNLYGHDAIADTFEHLSAAFDRSLAFDHRSGLTQRGLMLFDKHKSEEAIQTLARNFKELGHRWGVLRNMADVPVFLDSRASRLIQAADLIAFAMKRHYQNSDSRFFDVIRSRFYREGRQFVGLTHLPPTSAMFQATHSLMPNATSTRPPRSQVR